MDVFLSFDISGLVYFGKGLILRLISLIADLLLTSMRKMNAFETVKIGITVKNGMWKAVLKLVSN